MKRSVEEIRENMDYVGCDNATALEMCDEIERLQGLLMSRGLCQACLGHPMVLKCEPWCKEAQSLRKAAEKASKPP